MYFILKNLQNKDEITKVLEEAMDGSDLAAKEAVGKAVVSEPVSEEAKLINANLNVSTHILDELMTIRKILQSKE